MFDLNDKESILEAFNNERDSSLIQENADNNIILAECLFMDNLTSQELSELCEDANEMANLINEGILQEKTIVKLDKNAKRSRAEAQAELIIAKERKDRDLNKLVRVWQMRNQLLEKIHRKYGSQARTRAKEIMRNTGKSKTRTGKKVAARAK